MSEAAHFIPPDAPDMGKPLAVPDAAETSFPAGPLLGEVTLPVNEITTELAKTVTVIKESMQLKGLTEKGDRKEEEGRIRFEATYSIFSTLGMLPKPEEDPEAVKRFKKLYDETEGLLEAGFDRNELMDLTDKFESHPALQALKTLNETTTFKDQVVIMRRQIVLLLERGTAA